MASTQELASHQILDSFGKLRGVVIEKPRITLLCTPMAPLNLPTWDEGLETLPYAKNVDTVVKFMQGQVPSKVTASEAVYTEAGNPQVVLWFLVADTSQGGSEQDLNVPYAVETMNGLDNTTLQETIYQREAVGFLLQAVNILYLLTSPLLCGCLTFHCS